MAVTCRFWIILWLSLTSSAYAAWTDANPLVLDVSRLLHLPDDQQVTLPLQAPHGSPAIIYRTAEACTTKDYLNIDDYLQLKFFYPNWMEGFLDQTHCLVSWRANATARWVNGWFGHTVPQISKPEETEVPGEANWLLTMRNAVGWDQIQGRYVSRSISSQIQLPALQKRLSLLIESNEQAINPNQIGVPAPLQQQSRAITAGAIALQWRSTIEALSGLTIDAGVRSGPELFIRGQYYKNIPLGDWWMLHLHQTFVEGSMTRAESYSEASLERPLGYITVFRASTTWDWQQPQKLLGEQWVHALTWTHTLTHEATLSEGVSVAGITSPEFHFMTWGPGITLHQRFWRPWLFYELRPAYTRVYEAPGPMVNHTANYFLAGQLVPVVFTLPTFQERWTFSIEAAIGIEFGR